MCVAYIRLGQGHIETHRRVSGRRRCGVLEELAVRGLGPHTVAQHAVEVVVHFMIRDQSNQQEKISL